MNKVRVVVRTRPTNKFAVDHIDILPDGKKVIIHSPRHASGHINNQVRGWF